MEIDRASRLSVVDQSLRGKTITLTKPSLSDTIGSGAEISRHSARAVIRPLPSPSTSRVQAMTVASLRLRLTDSETRAPRFTGDPSVGRFSPIQLPGLR